jgi:hypothetical protein
VGFPAPPARIPAEFSVVSLLICSELQRIQSQIRIVAGHGTSSVNVFEVPFIGSLMG